MITNADTSIPGVLDISEELDLCDISEELDLCDDLSEVDPEHGQLKPVRPNLAQRLGERGMVTAEWAIGVVVAVSLAGLLLIFIVKGPAKELLTGIILKIINLVSGWGLGQ